MPTAAGGFAFLSSNETTKLPTSTFLLPAIVVSEMVVRGNKVEILRQGTDYEGFRLGIQLAINGQVATMFDLHKSWLEDIGDGTPAYEELITRMAIELLAVHGPVHPGVPSASPR